MEIKTSISNEELLALPLGRFEGKISVITDPEETGYVADRACTHAVIGFDTETKPVFVKGQRHGVALMQIALPQQVFLIRLKSTGLTPSLMKLLQNTKIQKAGVGIRDDIKALQRIKRFKPGGFFELTELSRKAGLEVESVKKLTALLLGFRISKNAQTSNWEAPSLTQKQIEYAATDAWVCLEIFRRLSGSAQK